MDNGYIKFYDDNLNIIAEVVGAYPNIVPDIYLSVDSKRYEMWHGGNDVIILFYKTRYFRDNMLQRISIKHGSFSIYSRYAEFEDGICVRCIRYGDESSARGYRGSRIIMQAPSTEGENIFFRRTVYHTWRPLFGYLESSDNKMMYEHNSLALSNVRKYCDDMINRTMRDYK